jgi:hypothetical protein
MRYNSDFLHLLARQLGSEEIGRQFYSVLAFFRLGFLFLHNKSCHLNVQKLGIFRLHNVLAIDRASGLRVFLACTRVG